MVDWERVERLRSKGWDWVSIAEDSRADFTPPEGTDDAGKALKALYYSRKSRGGGGTKKKEVAKETPKATFKKLLIPVGLMIIIIGAIWFVFALEVSLVSYWVPAFPWVMIVIIAGAIVMGAGLVLRTAYLSDVWKMPVAVGIVIGLVLSGSLAFIAYSSGAPILNPMYTESSGHGWSGAHNQMWKSNGLPVLFYYGSLACPYCSASSWAVYKALTDFGTFSTVTYSSSSSSDVYPNTPEVDLTSIAYTSNAISWDGKEGSNNQVTSEPGLNIYEQAYVNYYNSCANCGIPFYVVGGIYIEQGSLVDPSLFHGSGEYSQPIYTASQVMGVVSGSTSNPTLYADIVTNGAYYLEAYLYEADIKAGVTPPSTVASNSAVMAIVHTIT
jgi:MFS family permease